MADDKDKIKSKLLNLPEADLKADSPSTALLGQYNLYVQGIDKISDRRQTANSFFLSLNTGVCAVIGYLFSKDSAPELRSLYWILPLAGILLSYFWYRLVMSYRQLNSGKFTILHMMEKYLPLAPYDAEWSALGEGKVKNKYVPLTHIEVWIPRLFITMYVIMILIWTPLAEIVKYYSKMMQK